MIQQFLRSSSPVFFKAGDDDSDMFFEGVLQTVIGDIACHEAEAFALGLN